MVLNKVNDALFMFQLWGHVRGIPPVMYYPCFTLEHKPLDAKLERPAESGGLHGPVQQRLPFERPWGKQPLLHHWARHPEKPGAMPRRWEASRSWRWHLRLGEAQLKLLCFTFQRKNDSRFKLLKEQDIGPEQMAAMSPAQDETPTKQEANQCSTDKNPENGFRAPGSNHAWS